MDNINEIGEGVTPYKFSIGEETKYGMNYNFHTEDGDAYLVQFDEGNYSDIYDLAFYAVGSSGFMSDEEMNKGRQFKIISTVLAIIKDFIKETPGVQGIEFSGKKKEGKDINQRDLLYNAYVKKHIGEFPGWDFKIGNNETKLFKKETIKESKQLTGFSKFLVESFLQEINEQYNEVIGLFPGGYKPPTIAHFHIVDEISKRPEITKLKVLIGPKERDNITSEQSLQIWNIYKKYLNNKVEFEKSSISPVKDVLDIIKNNPQNYYILVVGRDEDYNRFKSADKYNNIKIVSIKEAGEGISGTKARQEILSDSYINFQKYIPTELTLKERGEIWNILTKNKVNENIGELNLDKHNFPKHLSWILKENINEITLNKNNSVETIGDLNNGKFQVGDITYEYSVKFIPNPIPNTLGSFYNIQFNPEGKNVDLPTGESSGKNYIKILSTMYKIIYDFVEKEKPDFIGISSIDNPNQKDKTYHTLYNNLVNNNNLPGYIKKNSNLMFIKKDGTKGRFVIFGKTNSQKVKETQDLIQGGLAKNKTLEDFYEKYDSKHYYHIKDFKKTFTNQLKKGIKIEMEHTTNPKIASEITKDNLWEDLNYYDKLKKIEDHKINEAIDYKNRLKAMAARKDPDKITEFGKEQLQELESNEIKYWANYFNIFNKLKDNPDKIYNFLKTKLKGEQLEALLYFYDFIKQEDKKILNEEIMTRGDFKKHSNDIKIKEYIDKALEYCCNKSNISKPKLIIVYEEYTKENNSFGGYSPSDKKVYLRIEGRNLSDALRTLFHEVGGHHKQNEENRLPEGAGKDGDEYENEANSIAGIMVREFGRENPEIYTITC